VFAVYYCNTNVLTLQEQAFGEAEAYEMIGLVASMDVIDLGAEKHPQPGDAFSGRSGRKVSWTLMKTNSNLEHDNLVGLVVVVSIMKL